MASWNNCSDCGHYTSNGYCTLNPEWFAYPEDHFCGQHAEAGLRGTILAERRAHRSAREEWSEKLRQQDRAIKAEKALKALRAANRKKKD